MDTPSHPCSALSFRDSWKCVIRTSPEVSLVPLKLQVPLTFLQGWGAGWGSRRLADGVAALGQPLRRPPNKVELPACLSDAGDLERLELSVVDGEVVVEDGDGHPVEDDAKGDAGQGQDAPQLGFREHVPVADGGDAHLGGVEEGGGVEIWCWQ